MVFDGALVAAGNENQVLELVGAGADDLGQHRGNLALGHDHGGGVVHGQQRGQRRVGLLEGDADGVGVGGLDVGDDLGGHLAARGGLGPALERGQHTDHNKTSKRGPISGATVPSTRPPAMAAR